MPYAFFTARGIVSDMHIRTTKTGKEFETILIDITDGKYERALEVTLWNQVAESAINIKKGDEVEISGRLESKENNGFYNARVTAQNIFKVSDIEGESKPVQSAQDVLDQGNNSSDQAPIVDDEKIFDADIPF